MRFVLLTVPMTDVIPRLTAITAESPFALATVLLPSLTSCQREYLLLVCNSLSTPSSTITRRAEIYRMADWLWVCAGSLERNTRCDNLGSRIVNPLQFSASPQETLIEPAGQYVQP